MSLNVPIIDVHRENFKDFWPAINLAIQTASFISIDAELSGLGCRRKLMAKSVEDRYKSIADVARTRSVLSLGISCFKLQSQGCDEDQGAAPSTKAKKTFLVQTFNILTLCNEDYMVEPGALAFLVGHGFDFNKQYGLGIPYRRGPDRDGDKSWPSLRLLFNHLLAARKPLTLHNGLVDLVFLYQNLYTELPPTSSQFVADLSEMYSGGIIDTKYVAEYEARMPASYLEYVFRKSQRDNAMREMSGASHVAMTFCQHAPGVEAVEYQSYALPPDFGTGQAKGSTPRRKTVDVCETYAAHGYCPKGNGCPKSHDPDAILDSEEIILEEKRKRKRRKRNRRNRNRGAEEMHEEMDAQNGPKGSGTVDGETADKKVKCEGEEDKEEEGDVKDERNDDHVTMTGGRMDVQLSHSDSAPSTDDVTGNGGVCGSRRDSSDQSRPGKRGRPLVPKRTGSHRAGFDAFMTGFAAAAFMARFSEVKKWQNLGADRNTDRSSTEHPQRGRGHQSPQDSIVDCLGCSHHGNKLYLSGKEYPLAIAKSSFTKTSALHREKMIEIEKLCR